MKMIAYFGILTSLAMIDIAAIWQFYSHQNVFYFIIILGLLGLEIIHRAVILKSQRNDEDQDDDDNDAFEPDPPPSLPDTLNIPACMRGYRPPSEYRETILTR